MPHADYILINHAHYDHVLEAPDIAKRTGAILIGSQSATNLALARGVPPAQVRTVVPGNQIELGTFRVDICESRHPHIGPFSNPMAGTIPADAGDLRFWEYAHDRVLTYRLVNESTSIWFHPTSTYASGELGNLPAEVLILGVTGEDHDEASLRGVLDEARPRYVLPTHYDNFLQPLAKGLALMPGLDLMGVVDGIGRLRPGTPVYVLDYKQRWGPVSTATGAP